MSKKGEEEESDKDTEEKKAEDRNEKQGEKIIGKQVGRTLRVWRKKGRLSLRENS